LRLADRFALSGARKDLPIQLFDHLDEVAGIVRTPRLGLIVDFDGTISELNPIPDAAIIDLRCADALRSLVPKTALVAVLSGRAVRDVASHAGLDDVWYVGNHGAEYIRDGVYEAGPGADAARESLESVVGHVGSVADDPAFIWEDKQFSVSVHYRRAENPDSARRMLQAGLDSVPNLDGLDVFWGNRILEIRGRTGLNKGHAVRQIVAERSLSAVVFIGDDTTDIDGIRAAIEMRDAGELKAVGIAVARPESPDALIELADYTVSSVADVARFLGWLTTAI